MSHLENKSSFRELCKAFYRGFISAFSGWWIGFLVCSSFIFLAVDIFANINYALEDIPIRQFHFMFRSVLRTCGPFIFLWFGLYPWLISSIVRGLWGLLELYVVFDEEKIHQQEKLRNELEDQLLNSPVETWNVEWFPLIRNAELRRQFIRIHGVKLYRQLPDFRVITEYRGYRFVEYSLKGKSNGGEVRKALIYFCSSSGDEYFSDVDPEVENVRDAIRFLNDGLFKEDLVSES